MNDYLLYLILSNACRGYMNAIHAINAAHDIHVTTNKEINVNL